MIRINFCSLPTEELFYPFIMLILPIYWVLISLFMRVWSYKVWFVINLLVEINTIMQQTSKLQLLSITSNSILSQDYYRSKDPLVEGCQTTMWKRILRISDLIYNDRSFVNFELSLVKIVMYLLILISDIDVVWLFINKSGIIKKKFLTKNIR